MDILVRLQLQPPFASERENIDQRTIAPGKDRHLQVSNGWIEPLINCGNIFPHPRFQPALGMQPP
jgi:hypothetical protein